jgi:hypothetical protein
VTSAFKTPEEWQLAMEFVLALQTEIPADGGFATRVGKPEPTSNKTMNEIPNNHPVGTRSPVLPTDPQKFDTDNSSKIRDEIPADGGFTEKVGKPEPKNTNLNEIPNNHPSGTKAPRTPLDWARAAAALNYGTDTSSGWKVGDPLPAPGKVDWLNSFPPGASLGNGPDGNMAPKYNKTDTLNRAPRSTIASNEDLSGDDAQLPDGSFMITNENDLVGAISKVENAEQMNPHRGERPWYMEIKRHIAKRAAHLDRTDLVPKSWQLSVAKLIEDEWAKDYNDEQRAQLAKEGKALPDKSYPIDDVEDLKNAIILARSGHGNVSAAKSLIKRRAKELQAEGMVPKGF